MEEIVEVKKKGKVLWILGLIALIAAIGLFAYFNAMYIDALISGDSLEVGIVLAFGLILFYLPGCAASLLSFIFTFIAWIKDKSYKGKLVTFIVSSVMIALYATEYLLFYIV